MPSKLSVANAQEKSCKPFTLQVMVFSPESGYKFELLIEHACTVAKDDIWKLVFDLYRKDEDAEGFVQLVHVSFTAGEADESAGVQRMLNDGISKPQADVVITEVHPAVKAIADGEQATDEQKKRVHQAMRKAIVVDV